MTSAQWQQLQALFDEARALDPSAREQLLSSLDAELASQLRALLAADAAEGVMDALAPQIASVAQILASDVPQRLGAYRIAGELGRGGMGVVYLAERDDGQFRQRVAIKVASSANADDPLHQRFLAERQILAALVHPHIARLLDGGVTDDGRPYLVMEYVDGVPITTYCDAHKLDVRARLRLFADVCAAVQHAHQNLVIHRDLKPSNILISTDGRVHLLDFGIAKLLNPVLAPPHLPRTVAEQRAMTPEYASPEQVRGDGLTTASDIYSLGVLLYELLCGQSPYRVASASPLELATAVCEQDPDRPSVRAGRGTAETAARRGTTTERLARQIDGDLDGIVLMALRKEPSKRYASADMLRQDIERALHGQPVLAHAGSRRYRVGKFVRRHRIEAVAGLVVMVTLLSGLGVSVDQARRVSEERDRAARALIESEGVTTFLLELFRTSDPGEAPPAELSAMELLERGARRADELADQPLVQARLLDVIGQMSLHMGSLDEAQRQLERAVAIRRATLGESSLELATALIHLAWTHRARGDYPPAVGLVREALAIRQRALPPGHPEIADALYELGWLSGGVQQEQIYNDALAIMPDTGLVAEKRVNVLQSLSTNLRRQGRLDEAVAADRRALSAAEAAFGSEHHITGNAMVHLADQVNDIERDAVAAEQLYRRGIELITRRYGANSIRLLHGLNSLGRLLGAQNRSAEAEQLLRRALAIRQTASSPEHPAAADQMQLLARELNRQGRTREAENLMLQALDLTRRRLGATHTMIAQSRLPALAEVYERQQRHTDADRTYRQAIAAMGAGSIVPGEMRRNYGRMLLQRGDYAAAEEQLLASFDMLERVYAGRTHPNVQESMRALMELYERWGKRDLVERYRVPPGRYVPY